MSNDNNKNKMWKGAPDSHGRVLIFNPSSGPFFSLSLSLCEAEKRALPAQSPTLRIRS